MKGLILAAGEGTRLRPITYTTPKPLVPINGKPILQYSLEALEGYVDEVFIVVGYLADKIKDYYKDRFNNMKIHYINQDKQLGTGHAVQMAEGKIKGKFLLLYGDNIYDPKDVKACVDKGFSALAIEVEDPRSFGVFKLNGDMISEIVEKPKVFVSNLANAGLYVLDDSIFEDLKHIKRTERGELELVDALLTFMKRNPIHCVKVGRYWIPIANQDDLKKAEEILKKHKI